MKLLTKVNRCFWDDIPTLKRPGGFCFLLALSIFTTGSFYSKTALANTNDIELPTGAKIVNGNINIESNQNQLKIIQSTQQGIINWNSFNIGKNASVHFQQPNAAASTLNRVTSATPSSIFGSLTATGQIFLLNPSGVYFGAGARVNVGSLIASTQSMSNEDFLNQHFLFNQTDLNGEIINAGSIIGDQVAMVSPRFTNLGDITAKSGDVVIASGDKVKLAITQNQSIAVELDASQVANLIDNQGTINAQGNIVFKADAMQSIVDQTIKLPQSANMMVSDNGTVRLVTNTGSVKATNVAMDAGALGGTYNNGVIDVSQENFQGGNISLTGQEVKVASLSKLNASGGTGGGSILIGGDWQGQSGTRQATYTSIDAGAYLDASAVQFGDGGKIVAWSDIHNPLSQTFVHGSLKANAGLSGGDGGQIETSGHYLSVNGIQVEAGSVHGERGMWLLDPGDITISDGAEDAGDWYPEYGDGWVNSSDGSTVSTETLNQTLSSDYGFGVYIQADNDIIVNGNISGSGYRAYLNLYAGRDILINNPISLTGQAYLGIYADNEININAAIQWGGTLQMQAGTNVNINADLTGLTVGGSKPGLNFYYGLGAVASGNTSDYNILKTSSGFSAKVNLPAGSSYQTQLGSDGSPSRKSYTVVDNLSSLTNANVNYALGVI